MISVVIGEGGSGGAIAIATADRVYMLEHSIYSVISPEAAPRSSGDRPNKPKKQRQPSSSQLKIFTASNSLMAVFPDLWAAHIITLRRQWLL